MPRTDGDCRNFDDGGVVPQSAGMRIVFLIQTHGTNDHGNRAIFGGHGCSISPLINSAAVCSKRVDPGGVHRAVEENYFSPYIPCTEFIQFVKTFYFDDFCNDSPWPCPNRSADRAYIHFYDSTFGIGYAANFFLPANPMRDQDRLHPDRVKFKRFQGCTTPLDTRATIRRAR